MLVNKLYSEGVSLRVRNTSWRSGGVTGGGSASPRCYSLLPAEQGQENATRKEEIPQVGHEAGWCLVFWQPRCRWGSPHPQIIYPRLILTRHSPAAHQDDFWAGAVLFHLRLAHDPIEKGSWLKLTGEKVQSLEQTEAWKPVLPRQSCQRLLHGPVITVLNLKYKFLEKSCFWGSFTLFEWYFWKGSEGISRKVLHSCTLSWQVLILSLIRCLIFYILTRLAVTNSMQCQGDFWEGRAALIIILMMIHGLSHKFGMASCAPGTEVLPVVSAAGAREGLWQTKAPLTLKAVSCGLLQTGRL